MKKRHDQKIKKQKNNDNNLRILPCLALTEKQKQTQNKNPTQYYQIVGFSVGWAKDIAIISYIAFSIK
jgi:hypothetical protein